MAGLPLPLAAAIACLSALLAARSRPEVERQPQPLALLGLVARDLARVVAVAERVDDDLRVAVLAAQVAVVGLLDAARADARAGRDAAVLLLLQLLRRDLAQRAEQLGAELLVRVGAQEQLLDVDAGELVLALLEVVEARARDVDLDGDVGVRRLGDALDHAALDRPRRQLDHPPEAAERALSFDASAGTGGTATGAACLEARARRRCSRRSAFV